MLCRTMKLINKMKRPNCNKELKIECSSICRIDTDGNKKTGIIGSCEKCLTDYFWIEVVDKDGDRKIEEFRRYFCG